MIQYVTGDATKPIGSMPVIISHVCNDVGAWGAGFVVALSKRWPEAERAYRKWATSNVSTFRLGQVQIVQVAPGVEVANMIAQRGIGSRALPPIRYTELGICLEYVMKAAQGRKATVHMPRIGCGLAGGSWDKVEPLIVQYADMYGVEVVVYDFTR